MLPLFRSTKCFAASRDISIVPVTLVWKIASNFARSISTSERRSPKPALLTRMSRWPNLLEELAIRALDVVFAADVGLDRMGADRLRRARSTCPGLRPVIATRDPASDSAFAIARPIPLDPPVTSAVAFVRFISTSTLP